MVSARERAPVSGDLFETPPDNEQTTQDPRDTT